ncbi:MULTISPECIES: NAD-dependent epimerase/dehydratase family protein [Vagococcus]|uniref:UDP-glucose 4-epimerase n=1 Tax=Vagococcus fluvialis bH819 TaxID=1255619 RepID=A0A1X6WNI8_9ENTE|nr:MULTISPECIES: NAD-dependent epimerase/dehydratase family protein [Vagococcus]SLM85246.1 UDP-glucose 4-epimerase [Vagococcus fluvialis bH819]HCM89454.1 NAD-dependent epimerase [Vagococcus sp.]
MKRILVTGENSYIGTSFVEFMNDYKDEYTVETISVRGDEWKEKDFSNYDVIYHVAGIAHADVGSVSKEQQEIYYQVNRDLTYDVANKYKRDRAEKTSQFIYMSSIIVYGDNVSFRKKRVITKDTAPNPSNFYGDSKLQAEQKIIPLGTETFQVCIVRPPMIYGPNSKGNYPQLRKFALKLPIFPDIPNERSMLFVGNLMNFIKTMIDENKPTEIYMPQNSEYVRTSHMVKEIANAHGKNIRLFSFMNWSVYLLSFVPGKIGDLTNKAFGNLVYEEKVKNSEVDFKNSVKETECKR